MKNSLVKHPRESTLDPILVLTLLLLCGQSTPGLLFVYKTARSEEKRVLTISSILFEKTAMPISDSLRKLGKEISKNPLTWALHGGKDYDLLFTASPSDQEKIAALTTDFSGTAAAQIGTITEGSDDIWIETETSQGNIVSGGYSHFKK
ncbi:MAG: hypothetical protein JRD47_06180 [Deltaproteobacteria bacterium]|nr:hypothetical protein [Deltaproteobacteria bacterium]